MKNNEKYGNKIRPSLQINSLTNTHSNINKHKMRTPEMYIRTHIYMYVCTWILPSWNNDKKVGLVF